MCILLLHVVVTLTYENAAVRCHGINEKLGTKVSGYSEISVVTATYVYPENQSGTN